jgi:hypothetical protein
VNARYGLRLVSGAPFDQIRRQRAFERAHPDAVFSDTPVGGRLLAWVPFGSGGAQFSGESLEKLLDQAEEFFDGTEGDESDTG